MSPMSAHLETLSPSLLGRLPRPCRSLLMTGRRSGPAWPISASAPSTAATRPSTPTIFWSDRFDRWGVVGINIRDRRLSDTLGRQGGLYTRLLRRTARVEARVIGSIVAVVDSQASPAPALAVLASPEIDVVTLTVTEKGYCHKPASGELDLDHPDIVHDLASPEAPRSFPGLIARALELRHGLARPAGHADELRQHPGERRRSSPASCDAIAARRARGLAHWIAANAAFPPPWSTASPRRRRRPTSTLSSSATAIATAQSSSASRSASG